MKPLFRTSQSLTRAEESGEFSGSPRTLSGDAWRQFRKHKLAMGALGVLLLVVLLVVAGPLFWHTDPEYIDIVARFSGMTSDHPFGADNLGRDTLARTIWGGRVSLSIGLTAMIIAMSVGTLVGCVAGYFRRLDGLLMRITDMFLSLPTLPLLLVITLLFREPLRKAFGPEVGIFVLIVVVIGMLGWMPTARLVRGEVLTIKEREFVAAALSIGSNDGVILRSHILPNVLGPVIVAASFSMAGAIITESALS
ncbi:MAG: ABC transporter permease, partial [Anaerolineaceae bacterium]|nr:ABC transporter permease [Anaerolineaceae bacterium]